MYTYVYIYIVKPTLPVSFVAQLLSVPSGAARFELQLTCLLLCLYGCNTTKAVLEPELHLELLNETAASCRCCTLYRRVLAICWEYLGAWRRPFAKQMRSNETSTHMSCSLGNTNPGTIWIILLLVD